MGQGGVEFGEGSTWSKFKNGKLQAELEEGRLSVQNREGRRTRDPVMLRYPEASGLFARASQMLRSTSA